MKLITKELETKLPALDTETNDDSLVLVHYFNPYGGGDWYGMTYNPETREYFGYVDIGMDNELGYFSLDELESLNVNPFGGNMKMGIERDLYWGVKTLREVKER